MPFADQVRAVLGAALAVGVLALLAAVTGQPLLFPSLAPTAALVFGSPAAPTAATRSVLLGHGVGLASGQAALLLTGLAGGPSTLEAGVDGARVVAVMLAVAFTEAGGRLLSAQHPPAGATTLIVALGLLEGSRTILTMAVAIGVFVIVTSALARSLGLPVPGWRVRELPARHGARPGDAG